MKSIIMSVDLEEWFHTNWFNPHTVMSCYRDNFPSSDVRATTRRMLKLFHSHSVTATFFVLLCTCKRYPGILNDIVKMNHEIALHGNDHQSIKQLGPRKFREEVEFAKHELEKFSGQKVIGYRAPNFEITAEALQVIADLGFVYDSSVNPCLKIPGWYGSPTCPTHPYKPLTETGENIIEFPHSVFPIMRIPGCGGWYLRNFGLNWVRLLLKLHLKREDIAILYVHPWEISENNPQSRVIPFHVFRRTGNWTLQALESIINTFKNYVVFESFKDYLERMRGKLCSG